MRNLLGFLLRRTALRTLSSTSAFSSTARSRPFITYKPSAVTFKQQWKSTDFQRRFASEDAKPSEATTIDETVPEEPSRIEEEALEETSATSETPEDTRAQPDTAAHAASETTDAAEAAQTTTSSPSSTLESAQQKASEIASSATEAAEQAGAAIGEGAQQAQQSATDTAQQLGEAVGGAMGSTAGARPAPSPFDPPPARNEAFRRPSQINPSKILYIGNLYFEVREDTLRREFTRFGNIVNARIVYDSRGLSKGFGYIEFENLDSATAAIRALDQQVLEGRRMTVQYHIPREPRQSAGPGSGLMNAPSRTLFIGNMSYEMSDKDLNNLFREIKNVLDVRVAIDRRSGQPRGFAHADFVDIA
ncbi:MAG: hypothetical protein Q9157_008687, partial [Trypethelium eluteriae]